MKQPPSQGRNDRLAEALKRNIARRKAAKGAGKPARPKKPPRP